MLVEVQALCSHTAFSQPRRTGNGVDQNRLLLLSAVLSKRVGLNMSDQDIFVNIVGGLRIDEPAADLAMAVAMASSYRNKPVHADLAIVGEVGLSGELRSVGQLSRRLHEAAKLGFKRVLGSPQHGRPQRGRSLSRHRGGSGRAHPARCAGPRAYGVIGFVGIGLKPVPTGRLPQ